MSNTGKHKNWMNSVLPEQVGEVLLSTTAGASTGERERIKSCGHEEFRAGNSSAHTDLGRAPWHQKSPSRACPFPLSVAERQVAAQRHRPRAFQLSIPQGCSSLGSALRNAELSIPPLLLHPQHLVGTKPCTFWGDNLGSAHQIKKKDYNTFWFVILPRISL